MRVEHQRRLAGFSVSHHTGCQYLEIYLSLRLLEELIENLLIFDSLRVVNAQNMLISLVEGLVKSGVEHRVYCGLYR